MDRKIRKRLVERGLASHMNDTKWRELCAAIGELPFSPAYQRKTLGADEPYPLTIEASPGYLGDWGRTCEAVLDVHIEWIKVAPRHTRQMGGLMAPVIEDCSGQLRALLQRLRVPFVESEGFFTIYGHSAAMDFDTL